MTKFAKQFAICVTVLLFVVCLSFSATAAGFADADADGALTVSDARLVLRMAVGLEPCSAAQKAVCDLNYDGSVGTSDAREILRIAVGFGRSDDSCADGMDGAQLIGLTEKYYKIYQKNGITYIDGIIIANKTYSLPSNYAPGGLLADCETAFTAMQNAAKQDGEYMYLNSGYRSYSSQASIYNSYVSNYGFAYAEAYAARPGHSEHQTGLAIDVTNSSGIFTGSSQAAWLAENCVDYGFILRYPEGKSDKTGYNAEAWHVRYVGTVIAEKIFNSGLCLEEYYGITSVYS